ncbi:MAG: hypothetical protein V8R50_00590 [Clostridia bacterium]
MTDITWMQVLALTIGSGGITSGAVAITMKLIDRNSITKRTLAVLSYGALSDKIEKLLDQDYATPEQRKRIRRVLEDTRPTAGMGTWMREWQRFVHCQQKIYMMNSSVCYNKVITGDDACNLRVRLWI